ncbi:hypothetical protein, partial [Mycobacterium pseudoshottsii]|uniref:hypothetical protein n=1 Tax=Mycobacterium pseudoshottsii TaxID=265949 RepID=UPI001F1A2243
RFDRQPPPRPPQSTIPQLTSLLINNAGALRSRAGLVFFLLQQNRNTLTRKTAEVFPVSAEDRFRHERK